jgi:hypothetical protein
MIEVASLSQNPGGMPLEKRSYKKALRNQKRSKDAQIYGEKVQLTEFVATQAPLKSGRSMV